MHKLYCIKIEQYNDDNTYRFVPDEDSRAYGAQELSVKASDEMLMKFLRRCRVADATIKPRSYRAITYAEIVKLIQEGKGDVYVYAHLYPKTYADLLKVMS